VSPARRAARLSDLIAAILERAGAEHHARQDLCRRPDGRQRGGVRGVSPTVETVIAAFYAAFDNRGGRAPAMAVLRHLFTPDGRITRVSPDGVASWDVETFIAPREAMLTDGRLTDFFEWETAGATEVTGAIAVHRSRYRKTGRLDGAPYDGEGCKLISLCLADGGWRIVSVLWEDF
jgi:hypothetical protein